MLFRIHHSKLKKKKQMQKKKKEKEKNEKKKKKKKKSDNDEINLGIKDHDLSSIYTNKDNDDTVHFISESDGDDI